MTQSDSKQPVTHPALFWFARGVGTFIVLALTLVIFLNRGHILQLGALGYLGAFLALLFSNATIILPAPGMIIVFVLGSTLNPVLIGVAGGIGAALGEVTGYLMGANGSVLLENSAVVRRIKGWMQRNGTITILGLSVFPNPLFDIAGLLAGAGHMPLWRFLTVTFVGKFIQVTLVALAGALSLNWIEPWLTH